MATEKHQQELVIDRRGRHVFRVVFSGQRGMALVTPEHVEGDVVRNADEPRLDAVGNALALPPLERPTDGLLNSVLDELQVVRAEPTRERRNQPTVVGA